MWIKHVNSYKKLYNNIFYIWNIRTMDYICIEPEFQYALSIQICKCLKLFRALYINIYDVDSLMLKTNLQYCNVHMYIIILFHRWCNSSPFEIMIWEQYFFDHYIIYGCIQCCSCGVNGVIHICKPFNFRISKRLNIFFQFVVSQNTVKFNF